MSHKLPTTISAGDLRHRVTIVKPSGAQGSMGGVSQQPAYTETVLTCWASIEAWVGSASLAADEFVSTSSHWVVIRNPRSIVITAQMRVNWNSRVFQIESVLNPTETTKLLVLVCSEINDSQQVS